MKIRLNKEEAIGYILKSYLDSPLPAKHVRWLSLECAERIQEGQVLCAFEVELICRELIYKMGFTQLQYQLVARELFLNLNMKSKENASNTYFHFIGIYPSLFPCEVVK
ncbi:hypothetical protein [Alkalibacillus aidingensis]|uniref:hypothetical protein n=1 Tax=Alkalibacillus aidingensis TaxID=2747607 RepID=UPI0016601B64|nr:hypothetical protein [Alkalibacillus aidingensis]